MTSTKCRIVSLFVKTPNVLQIFYRSHSYYLALQSVNLLMKDATLSFCFFGLWSVCKVRWYSQSVKAQLGNGQHSRFYWILSLK